MLERWLIASLVIGVLVAARLLLRRLWQPRFGEQGCESFDNCMSGGCGGARSGADAPGRGVGDAGHRPAHDRLREK